MSKLTIFFPATLRFLILSKNSKELFHIYIYSKPNHSFDYIHYFSSHTTSTKKSVMSSMFLRAYRLCSPQYLEDELTLLKCNFKKLGYKENFISGAMFKARKRFYNYNTRSNFSTDNILKLPTTLNLNIKSLLPKNINIIYN